ncbi:zinc-dependent metalloprotease [Fibrella aquatica]|uniref:zinc-dependent metalloprotease n=1 Tax=Fibrella aquatica TaxID=3242487 RepID=UPI003521DB7B
MHQHLTNVLRGVLLLGLSVPALAQNRRPDVPTSTTLTPPTASTASPTAAGPPRATIKPYREVITRAAKTSRGLFTAHQVDDKYYFEIADSLLGREFMAITRIAKAPTGAGYGGELANRQVLRWERGPDRRLLLRVVSYINVATATGDTMPISQAVRNSNVEPIAAAFDVRAIRRDTSTVIDVTDFFRNDNQVVSLTPSTKSQYRITTAAADRSFIQTVKSYPINTEVRVTKTFNVNNTPTPFSPTSPQQTASLPGANNAGAVTMEINTSMILLPKEPMRKRLFDSRVGFFANNYTVYDDNSQRTEDETFAVRWRLEAKSEADAERQKKGELIEPKKQIVYYIDPATPTKWRPFLKAGVADWQKAFEKAGWKNAIIAKDWNSADTTLSLEDARYSVIRYFASNIENAYGPNVNDPRSGEIIESHIGWYHNVMNLLRKWYMVQGAAVDARARKPKFDDALMGQLIRFVSSHEVGHTLGLRHNFGSSHATPVEKLRDKSFIEQNGHTASIMDYARFNYVAQPEDGITDLFPRIGTYDIWAIEWGYKPVYDTKDASADKLVLNTWVKNHEKDPRYWFGTESNPMDPRSQSEDLGDNAMKASEYGIKNLKRIMPNLTEWTKEEAEDYDKLREMYGEVVGQFRRYMGHVTKYVGGIQETPRTYDQTGLVVYEPTPRALQKEAMTFLNTQLFQTPTWILDAKIMPLVRADQGIDYIRTLQETTLNSLIDVGRLSRLIETGAGSAGKPGYTLIEFMTDLQNGIYSELSSSKTIDVYRRNLQKAYAEKLMSVLSTPASAGSGAAQAAGGRFNPGPMTDIRKSDIMSVARGQLVSLQRSIAAAMPRQTDTMSKYHLADLQARIQSALDPKKG